MKKPLLFAAAVICFASAYSQFPYSATVLNEYYLPLDNPTSLGIEVGWDDPEEFLPLPFDMVLWGDTCTVLATAEVGQMILGAGNGTHLIAPVLSDICDVAPADSTGQDVSEMRYTTEGVAPNRVFKMEYHNVGFYAEVYGEDSIVTATQRATYQVWLLESGTITFHYGPNSVTDHVLVADGFLNSAGLIGNYDPYAYSGTLLMAEGEADAPAFQTTNDIYGWAYGGAQGWGSTWPSEGIGYVFNPVQPTGIEMPETPLSLSAYPTPAQDQLHVQWEGQVPVRAMWLDAHGRDAGLEWIQPGQTTLDVSGLEAGVYVLRIEDGRALRVVIQH